MEEKKFIVSENMICPITNQHCDDECCTVGAECNISSEHISKPTTNKIFAILRNGNWWSVIDCGETKIGGFTAGNFWSNHFKKDGNTFRYYNELFTPPTDLIEWQEINIITKNVTVVDAGGHAFEGWSDKEDGGLEMLVKFAKLIGKPTSLEEVKNLINYKS